MRDLVDKMGGGRGREPERIADDDRGSSQKARLHDFAMTLHYDTGKAVLVSDNGEESKAVFLPRSVIEIFDNGKTGPAVNRHGESIVLPIVIVTVPEWLARDKGLI